MNRYKTYRFIIDIIYPNRCALCNELIDYNQYFCKPCEQTLPKRFNDKEVLSYCKYDDAKPLIFNAKYHKNGYAVAACAKLLYDVLQEQSIFENIDVITYVPSRKRSIKERGYCFPKLMAKDISGLSGIKITQALKVHDYEISQKELSMQQRAENLKGMFYPSKHEVSDKRVLLIDDVSTTGATLLETADVLRKHGALQVIPAAFAKTMKAE